MIEGPIYEQQKSLVKMEKHKIDEKVPHRCRPMKSASEGKVPLV